MKKYLLFIVVVMFFFSCEKDKDDSKPVITISSPNNLQSISGLDTIVVKGTVTDNKNIESVRIALINENDILVLSTIARSPNTTSFTINEPYFFNDIQLPSGAYTFDISAFDGENTTHEYISIQYSGVNRIREGIVVFDNNGSTTNITHLNNSFNVVDQYSVGGDFIGGFVNSYDQQIITSSSTKVSAVDVPSKDLRWDVATLDSYTGIFLDGRNVYVDFLNDEIKAYDKNGNVKFEVLTSLNFFGESGLVFENVFLSEQRSSSGGSTKLLTYWIASETVRHQINLTQDPVDMYARSSDKVVLFGNDLITNTPEILIYNVLTNSQPSVFSNFPSVILSSSPIDDCLQINSNVYLILQNGSITKIDIDNISSSNYLNSVTGVTKIEYDNLTNQLFVVSGSTMSVYDYSSQNLSGTYSHAAPILGVSTLYNK